MSISRANLSTSTTIISEQNGVASRLCSCGKLYVLLVVAFIDTSTWSEESQVHLVVVGTYTIPSFCCESLQLGVYFWDNI